MSANRPLHLWAAQLWPDCRPRYNPRVLDTRLRIPRRSSSGSYVGHNDRSRADPAIGAGLEYTLFGAHDPAIGRIGEAFLPLFRDPPLRERMARAARQSVVDNYSTARVAELYGKLFEATAGPAA